VARRSYRRRRLRDVARILPVLGLFLVFLPMLWGTTGSNTRESARDLIYLFAVWAGLVAAACLLARGLDEVPESPAGAEDEA